MRIGVLGDDFTGSSDIANTLARAGARTTQYVGVPPENSAPSGDAAVIALKTRSAPVDEAISQSLAACRWLRRAGAKQIVFKICSTFDSTPEGNIGPVAEALLADLDAPFALVCPAFPANGRTLYQGHLFVGDRLLSQSGMETHPLTPMTDPDIRRWLARQTKVPLGHVPLAALRAGQFSAALDRSVAGGARLVVADAIDDEDLVAIGRAAKEHRLLIGGSGIATALPSNFDIAPEAIAQDFRGASGPGLVLSGSCSAATRRQVERFRQNGHPVMTVAINESVGSDDFIRHALDFIESRRSATPLVASTADPGQVLESQRRYGRDQVAAWLDALFAKLAAGAVARGFRRIVVAGGETSGAVAGALGVGAFAVGPEIAPGVPALRTAGEPALALAFKSGNFGDDDFFETALRVLGGDQ